MADLDVGFSQIRRMLHAYDFAKEVYEAIKKHSEEADRVNKFIGKLQQSDPQNPVIDDSNVAFYNTEGMGCEKMDEILSDCNIPHVLMTKKDTGETLMAVPKQYQPLASLMLATERSVSEKGQSSTAEQAVLKSAQGETNASKIVTLALAQKDTVVLQSSKAHNMAIHNELQRSDIPHAYGLLPNGNHYILVAPTEKEQLRHAQDELRKKQTLLKYDEFMRKNIGVSIVEQSITNAQARIINDRLAGSCLGYNMEQKGDNWTIRYREDQTAYIAPEMARAMILTNGQNSVPMEEHANNVKALAQQAKDYATMGERFVIADANNPEHFFVVDKDGLKTTDGQIVARQKDKHFEAKVFAEVYQSEAPLIKKTDANAPIDNIFSVDEIARAKEGAAMANPEECTVIASELVCLKMETAANAPHATSISVMNAGIDSCNKLANAIEEDFARMNVSEKAKEMGMSKSEVAQLQGLSAPQKESLANALRQTHDAMLAPLNTRTLGVQDQSLADINKMFDQSERGFEPRENDRAMKINETEVANDDSTVDFDSIE